MGEKMKKGIVLLGLFFFLLVSFAASLILFSGDMQVQSRQTVRQRTSTLMVQKPSVSSVTPQKAVLTQGGDPVVVEANGANLGLINSAQVMQASKAVGGFVVTLDKSQIQTTLKVSLKALATAPIASDYQLAVFDADNKKLLDVPNKVLSIEVVAPVKKAVIAQKTTTTIKTTEPVQRQVQTKAITSAVKPGVASVSPQKAVLSRGGEPVVVEAKGTDLTAVGSVQVTRAGVEARGIEETLDKSQLPTVLKVSLRASAKAPIANDYQLSIFDAGSQKLLDVPTAVLAIEVVALATKTSTITTTQRAQAQAPRVPGPSMAQAGPIVLRRSNPAPMRWSPVSMENPDPSRPHYPTLAAAKVPKQVEFPRDQLKFATRPPLPFTPFQMKDPEKGTPISPDTLISSPFHKNLIKAQDYYDELNWLESSLNSMGYTLDKQKDPAEKVNLGVIAVRSSQPVQRTNWPDYRSDRARSQQNFSNRVNETRRFYSKSRNAGTAITKFQAKTTLGATPPEFDKPTPFSKSLDGTGFREANSLIGAEETYHADLFADVTNMHITNTWAVNGSILGYPIPIVTVTSNTSSPISGGQAEAGCTANFLGAEVDLLGSKSVTMQVPQAPKSQSDPPSQEVKGDWTDNEEIASYSWIIMVGYVPVTITVAANANVGVTFDGVIGPVGIHNNVQPWGATDLSITAAVDLYLVAAGARGRLNLISSFPNIDCWLTRGLDEGVPPGGQLRPVQAGSPPTPAYATHSIAYNYSMQRSLSALSGDISIFLDFRYPCWKDWTPGLCTKEYSYILGSWDGFYHSEDLVPPADGIQDLAYYPPAKIPGWDY